MLHNPYQTLLQFVPNKVIPILLCCLMNSIDKHRFPIQLQGHFATTNPQGSSKSHLEVMEHQNLPQFNFNYQPHFLLLYISLHYSLYNSFKVCSLSLSDEIQLVHLLLFASQSMKQLSAWLLSKMLRIFQILTEPNTNNLLELGFSFIEIERQKRAKLSYNSLIVVPQILKLNSIMWQH